jgi:predicted MFS family arabinose efflux permease
MLFSWLGGRVIDRHGYWPVFVACGIMPLVALGVILFLLGPLRPDPRFQEQSR